MTSCAPATKKTQPAAEDAPRAIRKEPSDAAVLEAYLARRDQARRTTLFDLPERVTNADDYVDITDTIPEGGNVDRFYAVAVPPGSSKVTIEELRLRDPITGARHDLTTSPTLLTENPGKAELEARFDFAVLGTMRRVETARIKARLSDRIMSFGDALEIEHFRLRISGGSTEGAQPVADSAFDDASSPYREYVNFALANPEAVTRYRTAGGGHQVMHDEAPLVEWMPDPALSPDFRWMKIGVEKDGLYTIDEGWLRRAGIAADAARPEELYLVCDGQMVPLEPVLPGDLGFADGQRLMFYGRASNLAETITRWYFLGRRPAAVAPLSFEDAVTTAGLGLQDVRSFTRREVIEKDERLETRVGSFLSIRGMTWVWSALDPNKKIRLEFDLPGYQGLAGADAVRVIMYYGAQTVPAVLDVVGTLNDVPHSFGKLPPTLALTDEPTYRLNPPSGSMRERGNVLELEMRVPAELSSAELPPIFVDRIEVRYESALKAENGFLKVEGSELAMSAPGKLRTVGFRPFRMNAIDVRDPLRPRRLPVETEGSDLVVSGVDRGGRYMLVDDDNITPAPDGVPTRWEAIDFAKLSADTLLIHHPDFKEAADLLAADLRSAGQEVALFDAEGLFERYTGGAVVYAAGRAFLQDVLRKAGGRKPYQVILVGDCTSDGRKLARNNVRNFVPTMTFTDPRRREKDQFATDQVYAWLIGSDEVPDLLVGRLSVNSPKDAMAVVRKQIAYRKLKEQAWAHRLVTIADYGVFEDKAREMIEEGVSPSWDQRLIPVGSFPWEDNYYLPPNVQKPEDRKVATTVTAEIAREFDEGTGVMTFFGHGAPNLWSNQRIWFGGDSDNSDNLLVNNVDRPVFVTSYTCNNGAIDYPMPRWNVCIAEDMMRQPGGAIGCFMPSGPGFPEQHYWFAEAWMRLVTHGGLRRFGVVSELSRLTYAVREEFNDHSRMYIFLGVPSMELPATRDAVDVRLSQVREAASSVLEDGSTRTSPAVWRVDVSAKEAITSGVATLRTPSGEILAIEGLATSGSSGSADLRMPVDPPLEAPLEVFVSTVLASGRTLHGGDRLRIEPQRVEIEELFIGPQEPGTDGMRRTARVTLVNRDVLPARGRMRAWLGGRELPAESSHAYAILPGARKSIALVLRPGEGGAQSLEVTTTNAPSTAAAVDLGPAPRLRRVVVFGNDGAGVQVAQEGVYLRTGTGFGSGLSWVATMANTSGGIVRGTALEVESFSPPPKPADRKQVQAVGDILPGETRQVAFTTALPRELLGPVALRMQTVIPPVAGEGEPTRATVDQFFDLKDFPDLEVVASSVTAMPERPTQGVSVFVTAVVRNNGAPMRGPAKVTLMRDRNGEPSDAVPSMTDNSEETIPALDRGASMTVRLRWDPFEEIGPQRLWMVADRAGEFIEGNRKNNRASVEVSFRTKWRLKAGRIAFRPAQEANKLLLVGLVENAGETDVRRVVVRFYRSGTQNEANRIGEVLVPRVPANSTVPVEFLWDISKEDARQQVQPTFTIAIKGSLQRVSSVTQ